MKKFIALLLALVTALSLVACGSKDNGGSTDGDTVKIGIFEPTSGQNGAGGKKEILGIEYANSIKPTVTINGKEYKVELVTADNASDASKAPAAAQTLVSKGVSVVIGTYGSGCAIAAGDLFKSAKVPAIGTSCTNPNVTLGNDYYFRISYIDPFQGAVMANFANKEKGSVNCALIIESGDDYSAGFGNYFQKEMERLGGKATVLEFQKGEADFSTMMATIKSAGYDGIFAPVSINYAQLIVEAAAAQGFDGAIYGARAAYIGGCVGTACTISDRRFGVPALGTMAHSWVQLFDSEYEAFKAYAEEYPHNCTLLVDTYNVLKSGVPNAIRVFNEVLVPQGFRPAGIRIDSGDITYLSRKARKMLDDAGFEDCKICASNSLDEYIIRDMLMQGAKVDSFGVGERLITSSSEPVFGGVYKLAAVEKPDGTIVPKIKISENVAKITTPCFKEVWRIFDRETDKAIADVITLNDEVIDDEKPYTIFDPNHTWKRKTVENFRAVRLRTQLFKNGECLYQPRALSAIRAHCLAQVDTLWEEVTRFENPHSYYVDLSQKLWDEKNRLLSENQY